MSCMDLVWVAVGFILGVAGDFAISLWLSYSQFLHSTANYRLEKTVEATKEIIEPENLGRSRDRYRYSLGVIIDHLSSIWKQNDEFDENAWPLLVEKECFDDKDKDRWDLFNKYVRPVIVDINQYSFLGRQLLARKLSGRLFPRFSKKHDQLSALTNLYNRLENVVGELDAAMEGDSWVKLIKVNDKDEPVICPKDKDSEKVKRLRTEYERLHKAWQAWLDLSCGGTG